MSHQMRPFVVSRPDGFVGVELSISDQLTPDEARELANELLLSSVNADALAAKLPKPASLAKRRPGARLRR